MKKMNKQLSKQSYTSLAHSGNNNPLISPNFQSGQPNLVSQVDQIIHARLLKDG
jgi:hypothetical protein